MSEASNKIYQLIEGKLYDIDKCQRCDTLEARCAKLEAALQFYADRKHASFVGEIEDQIIRTTRVEGTVETGWRARQALVHDKATND